jgi:hypothetical protein
MIRWTALPAGLWFVGARRVASTFSKGPTIRHHDTAPWHSPLRAVGRDVSAVFVLGLSRCWRPGLDRTDRDFAEFPTRPIRCILSSPPGSQMVNSVDSFPLQRSESGSENLDGGEGPSASVVGSVLPLPTALGCATGVAAALRERHDEMHAKPEDWPDRVEAGPLGAVIPRPEYSSRRAEQHSDMVAFGALLYELMVGSKPPRDVSKVVLPRVPRVGPEGVRVAATRLALQCLGAAGDPPADMQQVLTEVRLYSLLARQSVQHRATALELAAGNPSLPPRRSSWSAVADFAPPAPGQQSTAIVQPKEQPPRPTDAHPTPRTEQPPDPEWFGVPAFSDVACPICCGSFVHPSRPRTSFERFLVAAGLRLNRCHRCLYRYVAILGVAFTKKAFLREPSL